VPIIREKKIIILTIKTGKKKRYAKYQVHVCVSNTREHQQHRHEHPAHWAPAVAAWTSVSIRMP
jgi:hypothetical protein